MSAIAGLVLVTLAALVVTGGAIRLRDPAAPAWARWSLSAELFAILFVISLASGIGLLTDAVLSAEGRAAWLLGGAVLLAVPAIIATVWIGFGAPRRLAEYARRAAADEAAQVAAPEPAPTVRRSAA